MAFRRRQVHEVGTGTLKDLTLEIVPEGRGIIRPTRSARVLRQGTDFPQHGAAAFGAEPVHCSITSLGLILVGLELALQHLDIVFRKVDRDPERTARTQLAVPAVAGTDSLRCPEGLEAYRAAQASALVNCGVSHIYLRDLFQLVFGFTSLQLHHQLHRNSTPV